MHTSSQNKNALKRNSKFQKVEIVSSRKFAESRWLVRSGNGMEVNSSLSSSLNIAVGGAGAWPLTDRRVSTHCPYLLRACRMA